MNERIYIYDRSGNYVNDPEQAVKYATGLHWETMWPKGYGLCSFSVPRNILATWLVKQAYGVIVRDGSRIVYQGRLDNPESALARGDMRVNVSASGWYAVLAERRIRKWWVDNNPMNRMLWPSARRNTQSQNNMDANVDHDQALIRGGYGDQNHSNGDDFRLRYTVPTGSVIQKITSTYNMRTGEGFKLEWYNIDGAGSEVSVTDASGTIQTGSLNSTNPLTNGDTDEIEFRVTCTTAAPDTYDENDWGKIYDVKIYSRMHSDHSVYAGPPTYTNGEIAEDVLLLARESDLSADVDGIDDPGLVMSAFTSLNGDFETADSLLQRLAAYGDSSQNTWGACVWDLTGTSDSLPKLIFEARSISDYEYIVNMADLIEFSEKPDISELWNYIIIKYTDPNDLTQHLTGDDDATLQDTDSQASYGLIHSPVIDIGRGDATVAQYIGQRALALHKDPLYRTKMAIIGQIRNKSGVWEPANRVRAGQRVKLLDWRGGTTYFLRQTRYDMESGKLEMHPDLPPDSLETLLTQMEL